MMRHQVKCLFLGWEGDGPYRNEQHLATHTLHIYVFLASESHVALGPPPVNVMWHIFHYFLTRPNTKV